MLRKANQQLWSYTYYTNHVTMYVAWLRARYTIGPNWKKRQKGIQKIREIVGSYLCMQRFHKFWMWRAGIRKRKLCKFTQTCAMENSWKSLWLNLFWAIFCHLEPLCATKSFSSRQTTTCLPVCFIGFGSWHLNKKGIFILGIFLPKMPTVGNFTLVFCWNDTLILIVG